MNDEFRELPRTLSAPEPDAPTLGMSSVYRLFEEFIRLREKNERQHKMFDQTLAKALHLARIRVQPHDLVSGLGEGDG